MDKPRRLPPILALASLMGVMSTALPSRRRLTPEPALVPPPERRSPGVALVEPRPGDPIFLGFDLARGHDRHLLLVNVFRDGEKIGEGVASLIPSRPLPPPDPRAQAAAMAIPPVMTRAQRRERAWLARVREAERGEGEPRG